MLDSYYDPPEPRIWNEDCASCANLGTECSKCIAEKAAYDAAEREVDDGAAEFERQVEKYLAEHPYTPSATVITSCDGQRVTYNDDGPKFVDISETFEGYDQLTFECPKCRQNHKSLVYG